MSGERPVPPRHLWWLAAGFTVWCSALVALYAIHSIGCAFGWSTGSLRLWLAATLLAHLIVLGWMWRDIARAGPDPAFGSTGTFLHWAVIGTLITALVATAITFGPPLLLATCIESAWINLQTLPPSRGWELFALVASLLYIA